MYTVCTLDGTHRQCVNNHYAKFEYIEMKTFVSDNTYQKPPKHFGGKITKFETPLSEKIFIKFTLST